MAIVIDRDQLIKTKTGFKFEGFNFNNTQVSFFIIEAKSGQGAKLHYHPYEEIFINLEGNATFTIGDEEFEVSAGQVVIAPANIPHKFINSGNTILKQIDIHPINAMVQVDLE